MDVWQRIGELLGRETVFNLLHGHGHWGWYIANAGSASSERIRGFFENSYNIIKIENGNISVDLKVVGGERKSLQNVVKNYSLFEELGESCDPIENFMNENINRCE